jgi:hypothetical protein
MMKTRLTMSTPTVVLYSYRLISHIQWIKVQVYGRSQSKGKERKVGVGGCEKDVYVQEVKLTA